MLARFVVLFVAMTVSVGCAYDTQPVGSHHEALRDLDLFEAAFLELMNEHRASQGASPVLPDRYLNDAAYEYGGLMGRTNHFDHTGPDGSSPWDRMCAGGYEAACGPSTAVGENIAAGQWTAAEVFSAWRGSPGHNRNMLNPAYRVVGIGRHEAPGSRYRVFWVNTFGGAPTDQTVDPSLPPTEEPPMGMPGTGTGEEPPVVNPPMGEEEPPPSSPVAPPEEPGFAPEMEGFELHGACTVDLANSGDPEPWLAVVFLGALVLGRRRR